MSSSEPKAPKSQSDAAAKPPADMLEHIGFRVQLSFPDLLQRKTSDASDT